MKHPQSLLLVLAGLLVSARGQEIIGVDADSIEQVATDNGLELTCLQDANQDVTALSPGDEFVVPLSCCGVQTISCGGLFCVQRAECEAALEPGVGSIPIDAAEVTLTASVNGAAPTSPSSTSAPPSSTAESTEPPAPTETGPEGGEDDDQNDDENNDDEEGDDEEDDDEDDGAIVVPPIIPTTGGGGSAPTQTGDNGAEPTDAQPTTTEPEPTEQPSTTASTTTETTSSSSTSSEVPTEPTPYMISTVEGTERADFDEFINSLPDQGSGEVIAYEHVPWQSYVTYNLSAEDLADLESNSMVEFVHLVTEASEPGFEVETVEPVRMVKRAEDGSEDEESVEDIPVPLDLSRRSPAEYHLGMLSAPTELRGVEDWGDYIFDPVLGAGQSIYIIDSGYRSTHEEFTPRERFRDYTVPNSLTLAPLGLPENAMAPEDMTDHHPEGHGTGTVSVAGGVNLGAASRADIVVIKHKNAASNPLNPGSGLRLRGVLSPALEDAWNFALNDIITQRGREGNENRRYVINMSVGFDKNEVNAAHKEIMDRIVQKCLDEGIVVVIASGNAGADGGFIDETTPQDFGTAGNGLITVGGVNRDGRLFDKTTRNRNQGGSITVYGPAEALNVADNGRDSGARDETVEGTSFASPLVAAMASYFFSIESLRDRWTVDPDDRGAVPRAMKAFLVRFSVQRNDNPVPPNTLNPPRAENVRVAYNRAPDGVCGAAPAARRFRRTTMGKRQNGADSALVEAGTLIGEHNVECPVTTSEAPPEPTTTEEPSSTITEAPSTSTCDINIVRGNDGISTTCCVGSCPFASEINLGPLVPAAVTTAA